MVEEADRPTLVFEPSAHQSIREIMRLLPDLSYPPLCILICLVLRLRQVYGAPSPPLMSPTSLASPGQAQSTRLEPFLRVKITNMERNRKDLLIRFDATVSPVIKSPVGQTGEGSDGEGRERS